MQACIHTYLEQTLVYIHSAYTHKYALTNIHLYVLSYIHTRKREIFTRIRETFSPTTSLSACPVFRHLSLPLSHNVLPVIVFPCVPSYAYAHIAAPRPRTLLLHFRVPRQQHPHPLYFFHWYPWRGWGGGLSPQGSSTTGHNSGTNGREGAVGGESVRGGNGDNDNLHFSGRGAGGHDIPEWVLEPAAGQVPPSLRYTCRDEGASSVFKWSEMHGW